MAKKKQRNPAGTTAVTSSRPIPNPVSGRSARKAKVNTQPSAWMTVAGLAIITWLFYNVSLQNQFTNWDDLGYVKDNPLVKDLSGEGLRKIFTAPVMGNYHPFTILSYALEYHFFGLDPWIYHFNNLLLHVLVTVLVYFFVRKLTGMYLASVVAALLFGLHPMHVESVAWISGRKDMMYSVFYLGALITYLKYIRNEGNKKSLWYGLTLLFFVCSLLGKPVAVVLPLSLLLLDYFEKRAWTWKLLIEKIPFFLVAVGFGIRSVLDQQGAGALASKSLGYSVLERIALGSYALVTYLWKAVLPAALSCFYPYPQKGENGLALSYFMYPVILLVLGFLIWKFARRNRVVLFGILFFGVNIALLLQFIPVGGAIMADRYTYIPYLGFFIIAGWYVAQYASGAGANRYVPAMALGAYVLILGFVTHQRSKVWYDSVSLWSDELKKHPEFPEAHNNLGFYYFELYNSPGYEQSQRKIFYDSAYTLLNTAVRLKPDFAKAYVSLGELERVAGNLGHAKNFYYQALALPGSQGDANAFLGLGIAYAMGNVLDSAGKYFSLAVARRPHFPEGHNSYGNYFVMAGRPDSALKEYSLAIAQNPDMYDPYLNRGRLLQQLHRCPEALQDFSRAEQLMPDKPETYYARSYCYVEMGNKSAARQDVERAIALGMNVDKGYYEGLKSK